MERKKFPSKDHGFKNKNVDTHIHTKYFGKKLGQYIRTTDTRLKPQHDPLSLSIKKTYTFPSSKIGHITCIYLVLLFK